MLFMWLNKAILLKYAYHIVGSDFYSFTSVFIQRMKVLQCEDYIAPVTLCLLNTQKMGNKDIKRMQVTRVVLHYKVVRNNWILMKMLW